MPTNPAPSLFDYPPFKGKGGLAPRTSRTAVCPCCGRRKARVYTHRLDYSKCKVLERIAQVHARDVEWVKVQRDGNLMKDPLSEVQADDVHALRLTWFGLLERKARRTGLYRLTPLGWKFLSGEGTAPDWITAQDGTVIQISRTLVKAAEIKGLILDRPYWDRYAKGKAS